MSNLRYSIGLISAAILCAPTYGITRRADRADSLYTALGNNTKYQSVGYVIGPGFSASGVLISPKWVLTAAHVVDTTGTRSITLGGSTYNDAEHFAYPTWTGDLNAGVDIGLMRLGTAVTNVVPAARSLNSEVGLVGTSVGFGLGGTGMFGGTGSAGTKRGGTNVLDTTSGANNGSILADFDDPANADGRNSFGSDQPLDMEGSIASGDSGGGTFVDVGDRTYLAGIHSFVSAPFDGSANSSYSDIGGSTRTALFTTWIAQNTACIWKSSTGTFGNASSWSLGPSAVTGVPGANDIVGFANSATFFLTLVADTSNYQALSIQGIVQVDMGGHNWNLTAGNGEGALNIGLGDAFTSPRVIVSNGTLNTTETNIGLTDSGDLRFGNAAVWNNSGDVYVGGDHSASRAVGRLTLNNTAIAPRVNITGTLRVYSAGSVLLNSGSITAGSIDVQGGKIGLASGGGKVLRAANLSITSGGTVDLSDNAMIVDYSGSSPLNAIQVLLASGYAGGAWTGNGINSSSAAALAGAMNKTALGYGENSSAALGLATFAGQAVDATSILIRYVYAGDANLDKSVDTIDFNLLAANFSSSGVGWTEGDFDYSTTVDTIDFNLLASNFSQTLSAADGSLPLQGLVPEPTGIVGLVALKALSRRRTRRKVKSSVLPAAL